MTEQWTRPTDPPRRADNCCACGCGKPLITKAPKGRPDVRAMLALDPFASVACCRRYHGLPVPRFEDEEAKRPRAMELRWDFQRARRRAA